MAVLAATLVVATPRPEKASATVCEPVLQSCWDEAYWAAYGESVANAVVPLALALVPVVTDLANSGVSACLNSLCPYLIDYTTGLVVPIANGALSYINPASLLELANTVASLALYTASAAETLALQEAAAAGPTLDAAIALASAVPGLVAAEVNNLPADIAWAQTTTATVESLALVAADLVSSIAMPVVNTAVSNTQSFAFDQVNVGIATLNNAVYQAEHPSLPVDPTVQEVLSAASSVIDGALMAARGPIATITSTANGVLTGPTAQAMALAATATQTADILVGSGEADLVPVANTISGAIAPLVGAVGTATAIGQPDLATLLNDDPSDDYDPSPVDEPETDSSAALKALDVAEGTALGSTPVAPVVGVDVPGITGSSSTGVYATGCGVSSISTQSVNSTQAVNGCLDPRLPSSGSYVNFSNMLQYVHAHAASDRFNTAEYKTYVNDCTNFVSQSLFAGGWKYSFGAYFSDQAWWYEGTAPFHKQTDSWSEAQNLFDFAKQSNRRYRVYDWTDIKVGDIISVKEPNYHPERIGHSMIVTGFDPTGGILVSYHTGADSAGNPVGKENVTLSGFKNATGPGGKYFVWRLK